MKIRFLVPRRVANELLEHTPTPVSEMEFPRSFLRNHTVVVSRNVLQFLNDWICRPVNVKQKNMKLYLFQNITAAITATSSKTAITGPTTAPTDVDDPPVIVSVGDSDGATPT